MLLLAAIWGVSFLLIRIAAPVLGPIVLVNARMLIASATLLLYAVTTGRQRPTMRTDWKAYLLLGALNSMLPLTLEAVAVVKLNASLAALLATTVPLFTALVAAVWLYEQLTLRRGLGLLLGLAGVGVLVGWSPLPLTRIAVLAVGASLLASLLYAVAGVYAKVAFHCTAALPLAIGQELVAGLLLLPITLAAAPAVAPTVPAIVATGSLALIVTAGGNLLYFYLLARVGPTKTQSVSFLAPVFALGAGVLFLGEPFTASMALGLAMIIMSIILVVELRLQPHLRAVAASMRTVPNLISAAAGWRWQAAAASIATFATSLAVPRPPRALSSAPVIYDRHSRLVRGMSRESAMC